MSEVRKLMRLANSVVVAIPPQCLRELAWSVGDYVSLSVEGDALIIRKIEGGDAE